MLVCLLAVAACGDNPAQSPDAGSPDAPADAPPDPTPGPPRLDEVHADRSSHEVRQGETVELTLRGDRLRDATRVVVGDDLPTKIILAREDMLTVLFDAPHGLAPQALAVTVSAPNGTTTLAGAIDSTLYVVAADAPALGHGTNESPANLCELEVTTAQPGDTIAIGPGSYHCDHRLQLAPGVAVQGAGRARTELVGFGLDFPDAIDPRASVVSDLAIVDAATGITAGPQGGALEVARVDLRGATATGVALEPFSVDVLPAAVLDDVRYDGAGTALRGDARITITNSRFTGCAVGVQSVDGELHLTGTQITCATGLASGLAQHRNFDGVVIALTDTTITATAPMLVEQARITLVRAQLLGAAGCTTGLRLADGSVTASASRITCEGTALLGDGSSQLEDAQVIELADSEVVGGVNGVVLAGANDPSLIRARGSHVHGGSRAAISLEDGDARAELGSPGAPGGNDLTSDTGVAFRDRRSDPAPNERTSAHGTTLNGHLYDGQTITGPATLAHDYDLGADSALEF